MGQSQIQQCLTSIASFKKSKLKAKDFLLIHNRTNKRAEFREAVSNALRDLVETGQAQRAELWGYRELLDHAHGAILNAVKAAIEKKQRSAQSLGDFETWIVSCEDLVLSKLVWAKDSKSEMQLRDVRNLLSSDGDMD
jgi:hypothetical protein